MTEVIIQLNNKKSYYLIIGFALSLFLLIALGFSQDSLVIILLLSSAITLWITEYFPRAVTSLLVVVILIISGIFTAEEAFANFANSTVFFLLSAFLIGEILKELKLGDCCVNKLLKLSNENAERLVLYLSLLSYFLSFFIQVHIVVLLISPVLARIRTIVNNDKSRTYIFPKRLYLSTIWMSIIGSTATFLGGGRTLLAINLYSNISGLNIRAIDWLFISIPVSVIIGIFSFILIKKRYSLDHERLNHLFVKFEESTESKPFSTEQKKAIMVFIVSIFAWLFFTDKIGAAAIGLLSVSVYFLMNLAKWDSIISKVNWDIIFLYGAAFCLGEAISISQISNEFISLIGSASLLINQYSLSFFSLIGTEFINNAATVSILIPFASNYYDGIALLPIVYVITLTAGIGVLTPMSSPAMAILYSESGLGIKDLIKPALFIKTLSFIIINIYLLLIF
jgi:solute carrier family 13 (sodium-dependent dicarboxylate transporter), member 2/3/5